MTLPQAILHEPQSLNFQWRRESYERKGFIKRNVGKYRQTPSLYDLIFSDISIQYHLKTRTLHTSLSLPNTRSRHDNPGTNDADLSLDPCAGRAALLCSGKHTTALLSLATLGDW